MAQINKKIFSIPEYTLKNEVKNFVLKNPDLLGILAKKMGYTNARSLERLLRQDSPALTRLDMLQTILSFMQAQMPQPPQTIFDIVTPKN